MFDTDSDFESIGDTDSATDTDTTESLLFTLVIDLTCYLYY